MGPIAAVGEPAEPGVLGPDPPAAVAHAGQIHRWESLAFLHWRYDPAPVEALLPEGLTVDRYEGSAWVGLIPFRLHLRVPGVPFWPWAGRFVETNVRTYVRGPDGTPGIWFLSLDAARLGAVVIARSTWPLPYMWSRMRLTRAGNRVTYECRRRWPRRRDATSRVVLKIGGRCTDQDLTDLDHFLTARWTLFSSRGSHLARTQAYHEAWPLRQATVIECHDRLLVAAGLPRPEGRPRVLYSDGVDVRLSRRQPP
jgi:uncharacterized protein YqjF (DUF2071 family)